MRLTARDEVIISVSMSIDSSDEASAHSADNSCFSVTSKFVNIPNLVYKVSRTHSEFLQLKDEFESILPGSFASNRLTSPIQASVLEAFLRKATTFIEIKTSIQFALFLSSNRFVTSLISTSSPSKISKPNATNYSNENNLDPSKFSVEDIREYIAKQEKCMSAMITAASTLVKPTNKLANALSDLKDGFICLGHLDIDDAKNEEAYHSNKYLDVIVSTLAKVSKESLSTADMYTIDFIEPLIEYSRMLKSITTAIQQRESKKKYYNKMAAELENKLGPAGQILVLSKQEFERSTNRLIADFVDFRKRRIVDFQRIINNFIQLQMAFHGSSNDLWNSALVSCAELEGQASDSAVNRNAAGSAAVAPSPVVPNAVSTSSNSASANAMKTVIVELRYPNSAGSSSRKTILAPESLFAPTDDSNTRAVNVERLKNLIISTEASLSKKDRYDLQFFLYRYGSGAATTVIPDNTALSSQPVVPLDANALTELTMQTTIHIKLSIKEQQQQQQQNFVSEMIQPSKFSIAKRASINADGHTQIGSFTSASDISSSSSSSSSINSVDINASSSGDSTVSKWDANPLRNNSFNSNKTSSENNKSGGVSANVAMRERNLNNDLFKRHETNPLKNKLSRVVTGIRPSEFNNSPTTTQEPGFGLHIGASYLKNKGKDSDAVDVVKYCEEHGLLKLDDVSVDNSVSLSGSSSYESTIKYKDLDSVFGSICENDFVEAVKKDPAPIHNSQSSETFSWGASETLSMSMSISDSSQGPSNYPSISSDYSGNTIHDENEMANAPEDAARKSLYFMRAQKDVLEVSPAVSTYSRSASIDEWALSPGSRSVYTYNAAVEIIKDESPIKKTSLTQELGIADNPNPFAVPRKSVSSLQSQLKHFNEPDRQKTPSQNSPRNSFGGNISHPLEVPSSNDPGKTDFAKAAIESENADSSNQGKSNNVSIDTGSLQWDSNPFRKMAMKRSGSSADTRKGVSPPRAPLLAKVVPEPDNTMEAVERNTHTVTLNPLSVPLSPGNPPPVPLKDKVSGSTQHNNCFVDPRQPVVSDTVSSSNSNNLESSSASNQSGSASEGSSQAISEEDHLKWDANPLRNKANLSIPGSISRPENTTPGSSKLLSSIVKADSGSRQSLLSNKGPPRSKGVGGYSPAGSPVPSTVFLNSPSQFGSGISVPLKSIGRATSTPTAMASHPLAMPSETSHTISPSKPSIAASLFPTVEESSQSKSSSVTPTNMTQSFQSANVPSEERRAYSLPKETNASLKVAFSESQLAASTSKDLLNELSVEPLASERPPPVYHPQKLGGSPTRSTASTSPLRIPSPFSNPISFPPSRNLSPTLTANVQRKTDELLMKPAPSSATIPIIRAEPPASLPNPATPIQEASMKSAQPSRTLSKEGEIVNSSAPANTVPFTSPKSDPTSDDQDSLKWDANPLRNKSKRVSLEESGAPDKPVEKAVIGNNKLLSSMLLYDNAGKDIRANLQNKSMLASRNKGLLSPPSTGTRQSPLRTTPANDSPTPSIYPKSSPAATTTLTPPPAAVEQQSPFPPAPMVSPIPASIVKQLPVKSDPLTIVTSTAIVENKSEPVQVERSLTFSQDRTMDQQNISRPDSAGALPSETSFPVMARRPSLVRAQSQSQTSQAINSPGLAVDSAAAVTSPNGAPTNNNKLLSSIVIGAMDQRNPLSKSKSNSILANRQKGEVYRPVASGPASDSGKPDPTSSSLLLRPKKPFEDLSASFGFDDLSSKPAAPLSYQPTSQQAPTKEGVDPTTAATTAEVAAKWDLNPLRSTSKKKTNIVS